MWLSQFRSLFTRFQWSSNGFRSNCSTKRCFECILWWLPLSRFITVDRFLHHFSFSYVYFELFVFYSIFICLLKSSQILSCYISTFLELTLQKWAFSKKFPKVFECMKKFHSLKIIQFKKLIHLIFWLFCWNIDQMKS